MVHVSGTYGLKMKFAQKWLGKKRVKQNIFTPSYLTKVFYKIEIKLDSVTLLISSSKEFIIKRILL